MLPIPSHFQPDSVGRIYRVPYEQRAAKARNWASHHHVFVAGRSGQAAVEDCRRLCEFLYRNLGHITQVIATIDTHQAMQIFHAIYLVNDRVEQPSPYSRVSDEDVATGKWKLAGPRCEKMTSTVFASSAHCVKRSHYL